MVKKIFYYFLISFTLFVIIISISNFNFYKTTNQTIKSIASVYQYNFIIEHNLYDKTNLIKQLSTNYYNYLSHIALKQKIEKIEADVFKILSILKTLKKLDFKNINPFLLKYISYQLKNEIEIIKNNRIIISKHFYKIGKKTTLPCNPIINAGSCSTIKNEKYYYLVYSPYYKIIIETDFDINIDYSSIKQKIIEILKKIPNIIIYCDNKKIIGEFNKDNFYIFDTFKPLNIFFGFGIKYEEIENLSNTINNEIKKAILPQIYSFIILYLGIVGVFYIMLFIIYKKKISLVHEIFTDYKEKATIDKLTGVYNRIGFENKIQNTNCNYLLVVDLDNFKYINDTFGHEQGDDVLKEFSWLLKKYFKNDIVGRWGGDEFLICTNKEKEQIISIIDTINKHLKDIQKQFDKKLIKKLSISAGSCGNAKLDIQKRFNNADLALYKVKKTKKGNILFYKDIDYIKMEKEDINK
jgi:diguanylate cyclase (GGDEF)-like protein